MCYTALRQKKTKKKNQLQHKKQNNNKNSNDDLTKNIIKGTMLTDQSL